jgi:hypothetical protein
VICGGPEIKYQAWMHQSPSLAGRSTIPSEEKRRVQREPSVHSARELLHCAGYTVLANNNLRDSLILSPIAFPLGNQKVANQGIVDQAKGAAKETWGNAKDAANQVRESH